MCVWIVHSSLVSPYPFAHTLYIKFTHYYYTTNYDCEQRDSQTHADGRKREGNCARV